MEISTTCVAMQVWPCVPRRQSIRRKDEGSFTEGGVAKGGNASPEEPSCLDASQKDVILISIRPPEKRHEEMRRSNTKS